MFIGCLDGTQQCHVCLPPQILVTWLYLERRLLQQIPAPTSAQYHESLSKPGPPQFIIKLQALRRPPGAKLSRSTAELKNAVITYI